MFDFSKLAKFKLQKGSHRFPFKNGGLCVNEAAVVAAGLEYRAISTANDCPPCFSYVIATYALYLNDGMPYRERNQLLKPFILRLAGTNDEPEIEQRRVEHICSETLRRILEPVCSNPVHQDFINWRKADKKIEMGWVPSCTFSSIIEASSIKSAEDAAYASFAVAHTSRGVERQKIFTIVTEILEGAIMLGKHQALDDLCIVNERIERAKCQVAA